MGPGATAEMQAKNFFGFNRGLLLATASCASMAVASAAWAEDHDFDIPPQELGSALTLYGIQSEQEVAFSESMVEGRYARAVVGEYSESEALALLLDGNDLTYIESDDGSIIIQTSVEEEIDEIEEDEAVFEKETEAETDVVIVTGTNIRGVENPTVPVLSFDKEDIDLSGASTVDEFLRTIPQNFASQTQLTAESGNPNDATNLTQGTAVDLRGLGAGSTLTLLNGRRMTPAGQSNFVDVNVLPLGIIERVDVLTDGATAIYGSDAVGGVVNFVTRKDFEGFDINARYGTVTEGSKEDWGVGGSGGVNWGSGGVFGGVDYYEAKPLLLEERDFVDLLLPNEGAILASDTERLSVAGGANQEFGASTRLAVDVLYTDLTNTAGTIAGFVPTTNTASQEALFINSRFEYDISNDITASFFFDYGRNDVKTVFAFSLFGSTFDSFTELDNTLYLFEGRFSGKVFDLPGGPVSFSVGGLYRNEEFNQNSNDFAFINASREVAAGYLEVLVPVIGVENALPFAQKLQLSFAGRYEDYSDVGDSFDPKIGVYWQVDDQFSLRASYSESFRAPDLQQLNSQENFIIDIFPVDDITAFPAPAPTMFPLDIAGDFVVLIESGGSNPNLLPEAAKSWSAGISFQPELIPGLWFEMNYFNIQYSNRIESINGDQIFQDASLIQLVDVMPEISDVEAIFARATAGEVDLRAPSVLANVTPEDVQIILQSGPQNVSERDVSGFDLNVNYAIDTDIGQFSAGVNASYFIDFIGRLAPTSPSAEQINVLYRPVDFKMRANVSWSNNGFTVFSALNYVDGYRDNIDASIANGIDAWTTIDLSLVYETADRFGNIFVNDLRFGFSVTNLFDNDPPFVETPFGLNFDTANADPFGRQINFTLSKRF